MPVTYDALMQCRAEGLEFAYSERDTMLYALSIGMVRNPRETGELPFVFEGNGLKVMPTQSVQSCGRLYLRGPA